MERGAGAHHVDGHCFYLTYDGRHWGFPTGDPRGDPRDTNWEGRQGARKQGDRIGMLLDLDQGSMTIWKNNEKLGVMVAEGLSGPLCWAVSMGTRLNLEEGQGVRIESVPAPASPTGEELAAAKAWQRRNVLRLPQTATDAECDAAEQPAL